VEAVATAMTDGYTQHQAEIEALKAEVWRLRREQDATKK
jgi:hypothetical protein